DRSRARRVRHGIVLTIAGGAGVGVGVIVGLVALFFGLSSAPDRTASAGAALLGTRAPTAAPSATAAVPPLDVTPAATASPSPAATPRLAAPAASATATPPSGIVAAATRLADPFAKLTLDQKVGQLFMLGFDGGDGSGAISALIQRGHAGNVLILPQNVRDPLQLRELTDALQAQAKQANGVGLLVATDQEGGDVQPLPPPFWTALPAAAQLAGSSAQQIAGWGQRAGNELGQAGVNLDLAPVLDVNGAAPAGLGSRAFGTDPAAVSGAGLAFAQGLRAAGVIAAVAHFPGLGSAAPDPRSGLPVDARPEAQLRASNLPPFADAVRGGAGVVLVGGGVYPAWDAYAPALFSQRIVGGLLRGELGYQGVVMTDDLAAAAIRHRWSPADAAVKALQAGADLLLISGPAADQAAAMDAVIAAVKDGRIPEAQIDASVARVLALKLRYGVGR
ncbi:MAG TPA: glycoside hydrolase family 3 N-terminal domain-containing protein, partial [Dehalococcoidia bacterium]|nr:glycoside hydrolase family 3 N-terminal domain-containing protein [Dehalococcoidia bacterium]